VKRRTQGFTLVELLLALAISSILIVLLVNIVAVALNAWETGRAQIDTVANARQALGRIIDEIKGAIASPNQIEFSENVPRLKGTTVPQQKTSENIFFIAAYPNSAPGDLCVIAYRHNSDTHELQRAFVDSLSAWTGTPRYQAAGYANLQWRIVAEGVLEFEIQSYSQQDLDNSTSPAPPPPDWNSLTGGSAMLGSTPRVVVIRIRVIDEKSLAKLAGLSPGNVVYDRIVNRAAREFTASVTLAAAN
jgi:prepilin-type N-terminal cleavage/methylation domain-containing protein